MILIGPEFKVAQLQLVQVRSTTIQHLVHSVSQTFKKQRFKFVYLELIFCYCLFHKKYCYAPVVAPSVLVLVPFNTNIARCL